MRPRTAIFLMPLIVHTSIYAQAKCSSGYQPYGERCVSQRMADYISCIEASGGNREELELEVNRSGDKHVGGGISASGAGPIVKGSGSLTLNRSAEDTLAKKLRQRWYSNSMASCATILDGPQKPAPAPHHAASSPKTNDRAASLEIIVDSSGAAAEAIKKFSSMLNDSAAKKSLEQKVEKQTLKRVIADLVRTERAQAPLPWLLRNYVKSDSSENWQQVLQIISMNAPVVSELVDVLKTFDGDLIYKDIDTYRQLQFMVDSKGGLYTELYGMPPPKTEEEKSKLIQIANNFDTLIAQTKVIETKLSTYLKGV